MMSFPQIGPSCVSDAIYAAISLRIRVTEVVFCVVDAVLSCALRL